MKKVILIFCCVTISFRIFAQHCPWDCSGMVMLKTLVPKEMVYKLEPVLVDEGKKLITDTMYGTGKPTYDLCEFLDYKDFTKYRTKKIAVHHWYEYDTVYHFAEGCYIVKYNFCEYTGKALYLRYTDPYSKSKLYHYIEISEERRIHLHNYSNQLYEQRTEEIKNDLKNVILVMNCKEWGLTEKECK